MNPVGIAARQSLAEPQPNPFGLRREVKRHAALEALFTVEKRCRRCALPPQSKIFAPREEFDGLQCGTNNSGLLQIIPQPFTHRFPPLAWASRNLRENRAQVLSTAVEFFGFFEKKRCGIGGA